MSGTASDYNISRLYAGIVIAMVSFMAVFLNALPAILTASTAGVWISFVTIMYSIMMFASSYVEEEHHFWYWSSSGWLAWLSTRK